MSNYASSGYISANGAQTAINTLESLGVELCFAYPGAASVELQQALANSSIRTILPRHEQGGAFAADGYARATGKTGVCMTTSGPGATNLLTGIADAFMDSIPMVIFTGQVDLNQIGTNAFQEVDIIGMTRPVVKHSFLITDIDKVEPAIREAFVLAQSGRPGPVLIDFPKDIQKQIPTVKTSASSRPLRPAPAGLPESSPRQLAALIHRAKRPCIYAGGGIISGSAATELLHFAEGNNIPVATSLMGIGAFPENHRLALKFFGMHGSYYANRAVDECDLLLVFGARFSDRSTGDSRRFAAGAKIVHIDIDDSEINKIVRADFKFHADIRMALSQLNEHLEFQERREWLERIAGWKAVHPLACRPDSGVLKAQQVIAALNRHTDSDAVIVPGVGQHQMWAAQFYTYCRPRQFLTSGGLGSMGFGLPAAMGAKLAMPEECVINIDGDGSFQMNIQELGTIAAEGIALKMVILNNRHLGMVAQIEDIFYRGRRGNTDLRCKEAPLPSFVGIANAYGIPGRDVWSTGDLDAAIAEMLAAPGPFLLDCHIEYRDHVLPMIPAGKSCREIILS
ncbi:MAG: biosynthetic-type acetolactate synthase large subunit [Victivallaceae bacterium]|nr:biosynthetic-type acetolactate synthase large subunit [Victivallaceae bacterium]